MRNLLSEHPGAVVLKPDTSFFPGLPDRFVLIDDWWGGLEFKADEDAPTQPNQPFYIDLLNRMSFASFVYPQNEGQVWRGIQRSLRAK